MLNVVLLVIVLATGMTSANALHRLGRPGAAQQYWSAAHEQL
ncbi:hypothetical protein [Rhodococcus sp. NPDC057529]